MGDFFEVIIQISLISIALMFYGTIHQAAVTHSARESGKDGLFSRQVWIVARATAFFFYGIFVTQSGCAS